MNNFSRNLVMWLAIALLLAFLFNVFQGSQNGMDSEQSTLAYSDFMSEATSGRISDVSIKGQEITGHYSSGDEFSTLVPENENVVERLQGTGVRITAQKEEGEQISALGVLLSWFPMLLLIGVWIFFMRQMQSKGGGGAMGFGKSKARMLTEQQGKVVFDDVAGIDEAKSDLQEVVEFLKDPHKFQRLGGKIPKGALLVGPPGTGKTLVARAVAGEAGVPFFTISGSDFVEMFVGVGASRVRDMFEQAKKNAPCIIFIDEIDAVGRHRGAGLGGGNDEREQTLNQLLVEMDGFEASEGVIILAATNRPDVLDPALMRPGRFDRQVVIPLPDVVGREKILKVHMKKVPLAKSVDAAVLARGTPGFSGADLANLVNEAALLAARRGKRVVAMEEFEDAKDKVMMGSERKSMVMSDEEKKLTAYHEAGHAIVALHEPESDPIHKATIIPRGRALGLVMRLPERDRISMSLAKLKADLAVAMGGRIAEEMIFGKEKVTTGASSDIKQATDIARRMVTEWGMSDKLGPLHYGSDQEEVFLGHSVAQSKNVSDETAAIVDEEIKRIVQDAYNHAEKTLKDNNDELHRLAEALLEYEMLTGDEIRKVLRGEKIVRDTGDDDDIGKPRSSVPSSSDLGSDEKDDQDDVSDDGSLPQGA
ncbi:MAG: ATP-dependent zinc metalloprotease FtsH [Alphaproteobacteria bacterium]|jgi:cell division protease FtsH|nr:ATP-dependent zinc metalloprotease FtsH [Alphaproteobacteria bacterium]MDP7223084.1 ATP-dependent zinc metalloprotease FtsH [Alphaproteobacteria bacterium]